MLETWGNLDCSLFGQLGSHQTSLSQLPALAHPSSCSVPPAILMTLTNRGSGQEGGFFCEMRVHQDKVLNLVGCVCFQLRAKTAGPQTSGGTKLQQFSRPVKKDCCFVSVYKFISKVGQLQGILWQLLLESIWSKGFYFNLVVQTLNRWVENDSICHLALPNTKLAKNMERTCHAAFLQVPHPSSSFHPAPPNTDWWERALISAIPLPSSPFNVTSHNCVTEVWQILSLLSPNICHNRNQFQSFILFWYKYFKKITHFLRHSHQTLLTSRLFIGLVSLFSAWLCLLEASGFEQVPWSFCTSVRWGWWLTTHPQGLLWCHSTLLCSVPFRSRKKEIFYILDEDSDLITSGNLAGMIMPLLSLNPQIL